MLIVVDYIALLIILNLESKIFIFPVNFYLFQLL